MKGIWRRLSYYLFGVIIGSIFVAVLFGNRSCSWLPGSRIKNILYNKVIVLPESQINSFHELGIDSSNVFNYLIGSTIDFSESLKDMGVFPKVYILKPNDTIKKRVQFSIYEDSYISVMHVLDDNESPQRHEQLKGLGKIIRIPRDSSLIFIDPSNYTQCKARGLAYKDEKNIINSIKKDGKINFSKSNLMLPKSVLQLEFTQNDTVSVKAETIWLEGKIVVKDFFWDKQLDCE